MLIHKSYGKQVTDASYFDKGNMLEVLLSNENLFPQIFTVLNSDKPDPSSKAYKVIHKFIDDNPDLPDLHNSEEYLLELCNQEEIGGKTWKDERKLKAIYKYLPYYQELQRAKDKIIVDPNDYDEANTCATIMKEHEHTRDIIQSISHHQTIVEGEINDVLCKGLLDGLLVNDTEVPIKINEYTLNPKSIAIIDFKSVYGSTNNFDYNLITQRYDLQASFYTELTMQTFPEYTVQDFLFIVGSMNPTYNIPVIRQVTPRMFLGGKYGWDRDYNPCNRFDTNKFKLGFMDGLDIYKHHVEQEQWEMSPHIFTNKGFIKTELHEA